MEKFEADPLFSIKGLTKSCTCIPDRFDGIPSPDGCWPYDGCLGDGSGPCDDGIDNDCDCKTDCHDPQCGLDCDACDGTCDDPDCSGLPLGPNGQVCSSGGEPVEFCYDDFDNDADGYVDECDASCNGNANINSRPSAPHYPHTEACDGRDNDCDGSTDEGGVCNVNCNSNSDCGNNGYIGSYYCSNNDVYRTYRTYTCRNPGTPSSYCSSSDSAQKISDCGDDYCGSWGSNYCYNNDVYKSRTCYDKGCSGGSCFSNSYTESSKVQECGSDSYSSNFCYNDDLYRYHTDRGCSGSSCFDNTNLEKVEECRYGCKESEARCLEHCEDNKRDADEEDIDCGGRDCKPCPLQILIVPYNWEGSHSEFVANAQQVFDFFVGATPLKNCRQNAELLLPDGRDYGWNWDDYNNDFFFCKDSSMIAPKCDQRETLSTIEKCAEQYSKKRHRKFDFVVGLTDHQLMTRTAADPTCDHRNMGFSDGAGGTKAVIAESSSIKTTAHELGHEFGLWDQYCDCSPVLDDANPDNDKFADYCGFTAYPSTLSNMLGCKPGDQANDSNACCEFYGFGYYDPTCGMCEGNYDMNWDDRTIMAHGQKNYDAAEYGHLLFQPVFDCSEPDRKQGILKSGKLDGFNLIKKSQKSNQSGFSESVLDIYLEVFENNTILPKDINISFGFLPLVIPRGGEYSLRIFGEDSSLIFYRNYTIDFVQFSDPPEIFKSTIFHDAIQYNDSMKNISFFKGNLLLFSSKLDFCNNDSVCEVGQGENYLSCPSDCLTYGTDGICNNYWGDGCDKDCDRGIDADCSMPPVLHTLNNISAYAGDLVIIKVNATDPDNLTLVYYINDSRFSHNNLTDNIFKWQTTEDDVGNYTVEITVSDGEYNDSGFVYVEILSEDEEDLTVDGMTITLCGEHHYRNVNVVNGGIINVCDFDGTNGTGKIEIYAYNVLIDDMSMINGSTRGYRGHEDGSWGAGEGPGGGDFHIGGNTYGSSDGFSIMMGSGGGVGFGSGGGGYGGKGAICTTCYGGLFDAQGGDGGGSIKLLSRSIEILGRISVDGAAGKHISDPNSYAAGGSGGGILIHSKTFTFRGNISARGGLGMGWGTGGSGGGGGGRVKIFADSIEGNGIINVDGAGAVGSDMPPGEDGTIFHSKAIVTSLESPTHANQLLSYTNPSPLIFWDDSPDKPIYYYILDNIPNTTPTPSTGILTFNTNVSFYDLQDGTYYFHIVPENDQGVVGTVALHYQINIDTSQPNITSSTHPAQTSWYNHNDPTLSWTTKDPESFPGSYYIFDQNNNTIPTNQTGTYTEQTSVSFTDLADGTYYFHTVKVDTAGNIGEKAAHYRLNIDTTKPTPVTSTNTTSKAFGNILLEWQKPDDLSGIAYYQIFRSTQSGVIGSKINNDGETTSETYTDLGDGLVDEQRYYYTVFPIDKAGNKQFTGNAQKDGLCDKSLIGCNDSDTQLCQLQQGVCKDSYENCTGSQWMGCTDENYNQTGKYQLIETLRDGLDNDCDGLTDEIGGNVSDADSDGVIDLWDLCPDTGADTYVNKNGCPFNMSLNLVEGWNLVCSPSLATVLINQTFNTSQISSIYMYNKSKWYSYNPSKPASLNTLNHLYPGYGYWVDSR